MNLEQSVATGANQGTYCDADHIEITGIKKECGGSNQGHDRLCGGAFNIEAGNTVSASSLCGMYLYIAYSNSSSPVHDRMCMYLY